MLTKDYFTETNPYTKHAECDKYYLDQLEENYTKMTKTRDTSLGSSDKLDYKLLTLLVGVFCVHFYVLALLAQQCFTFFLTTFLLNDALALRCQHYAYHLIHFLLAHFFTFASKMFFSKVSQLTNHLFAKAYSVVKRKYLGLSSLNFGNLCHLLQKCKIRQLLTWKEKTEDEQTLISIYTNKNRKRRKLKKMTKNNFFAHLQLGAYHKFKSSKNVYQRLIHDQITITNYYCNNTKAANWTVGNYQILTVSDVNYIEVSRIPVDGTQPPLDSSGPSQDQSTADYTIHNTGVNNKERNNSKNPFRRILDNGLSKRIEFTNINVGAIKNTISRQLKNKHEILNKMKNHGVHFQNTIITKWSRKTRQGEELLSKKKRKFKWKKRHKEYVVFKIVSQRRMGDDNELTFVAEVRNAVKDKPLKVDCECFKYDFTFEDVQEVEDKADWYMRRYERNVGKAVEKSVARKDILKMLKRQAVGPIGLFSPTASGYKDQVDPNLKPLELDWGESPKAVLCGCPITECICAGNTRLRPTTIPRAGVIDINIPRMMLIQLLNEMCGRCCNRFLYKMAPAPASTLMPRLSSAVSTRKVFYLQKRSDNLAAENCAYKCKHFFFKPEKVEDHDVAVKSVHDRADSMMLDKLGNEIYKDRTNEINERVSRTGASGSRLASQRLSSGMVLGSKIPSGRVSGGGLDGEKVPSGRVSGEGLDGEKVPSGRVSGEGLDGEKVPSGRFSGQSFDGDKVPSDRVPSAGFEGDSPMIGDGLVEQEIEGAGETPLYSKDDNIYARGFILTTATQTEFDENGKLLREETDRVKIAFTLRYTTKKDYDGNQMNIEICDPCAPTRPSELTIGSIKEQICKMKKGIEGTLKTLSSTVSSYTRNWKLGVEEMSEHISSYAKDLQTMVGFGRGEGKDDLTDKGTCNPCADGMEPTYDRDYFEKAKYPTKGRSWPEITPRMRYNESNQTDNLGAPAKSEYELVSKLKNYLKNLRKPKDNVDTCRCRISSQKSHSDDSLIRTKNNHDFFKNECEPSSTFSPYGIQDPPCAVTETDALSSKKMVKCKCQLPESSQEVEYDKEGIKPLVKCVCSHSKSSQEGETDKEVMKPLVRCLCHDSKSQEGETDKKVIKPLVKCLCHHSKSQERENDIEVKKPLAECTCHPLEPSFEEENGKKAMKPSLSAGGIATNDIVIDVANKRQNCVKEIPNTITNNEVKTQSESERKMKDPLEVTTDTVVEDTLKRISEQNSNIPMNTSSKDKLSVLNIPPDTAIHNEENTKEMTANVSDSMKQTSEQKSSEIISAKSTTAEVEAGTPNKHDDNLQVTPDGETNDTDTAKDTLANEVTTDIVTNDASTAKDSPAKEIPPDTVTNDAEIAKNTPANEELPDTVKNDTDTPIDTPTVEIPPDTMTNDADTAKDTPTNELPPDTVTNNTEIVKDTPAKEVTPDKVTNDTATAKNTPSNVSNELKRTSKQKASKTKSVKSTTSEVEAGTPEKHQYNVEVTPDTGTNKTDTAKDTPSNVSNKLKKQKGSKTKSVNSTTSKIEAGAPSKHQDNVEVTPDTVTNDTDIAKDTPSNVSNKLKQTSKEKSSKTKPTKSTTSEVEVGTPKKHHDQPSIHDTSHQIIYLEVTPDTVTNDTDTAKDTLIKVSNDLDRTSKQKGSKTKSVKSTTSEVEAGTPKKHQDNVEVTPDTVTNDTDIAKDTLINVSNDLKRTSKQKTSKTKSVKSTTSEVEAGTPKKHLKNLEVTSDTVTNDTDTAKDKPSNVSNKLKQTSKEKSSKTKPTKDTTSEVEVGTPKKHHDQPSIHDTSHQIIYLEVTPDTVTNDTDTAKDTPINVSNDLKQTSKQKSSITKSVKSTTSKIEAGIPSKHQDNVEVTPDTVTNDTDTAKDTPSNVSNKLKQTSKEKSSKAKPTKSTTSEVEVGTPKKHHDQLSIHDTSHQIINLEVTPDTVTNDTDTAKDTPINVSNDLKQTSKQKSSIHKSVKSTTSKIEAGTPSKHQDNVEVTPDTVTNVTDTAKDTPSNVSNKLKQTSKEKSSKTKPTKSTTSEVEGGTPKKHHDQPSIHDTSHQIINLEVTPDTVTNDTDTAKDTPTNVSIDLEQTSKQKSSITKSVKSTTSQIEAGTPSTHQDNVEITPDTVTNDTDTAKDTPSNVSNKLKQTSKKKSSKTKPTKSTTSEVEVGTPKKHHDQLSIHDTSHQIINLEVTPDTVTNDTDTAKDTPTNVSNDLKRTSKPKTSKTKSVKSTTSDVEAGTPKKHLKNLEVTSDTVTNDTDTAKDKPSNVSNKLKQTSKEKSSKTKPTKDTTSEVEVGTPKKHHDQPSIHDTSHQIIYLEVTPDTVTNDTDTAKDTPINVSNDLKQTSKQKSSITKSVKSTTSKIEAGIPSKHQDNVEVTPDTVTNDTDTAKDTPSNVSNKLKQTSKEKSSKTKPTKSTTSEVEVGTPKKHHDQLSIHDTSHQIINLEVTPDTVTNDTDTAKDTPTNVSNDLKQTSKQKSSITKSVKSTTSKIEAGTPSKHQDNVEVTPDTVTNDTDTAKDTPSNVSNKLKQTSKEKSSKTKPTKSTTSEVEVGTPKKHHDQPSIHDTSHQIIYLEVTPDTVTNDTDIAKDTPINVSNDLKRTTEQKGSKTKSVKSTTSELEAGTPKKQDNDAVTPDTVADDTDTAKDTPIIVSNDLKRTFKQKSSKTKSVKSATSEVEAGTPKKHLKNLEVTSDTVTNDTDTAKDKPSNVSNKLKRTSKEKSSKTKPTKSTTSEVEVGTPKKHHDQPSIHDTSHQIIYLEVTPDTVTNDTDTAKDKPINVSNDLDRTSKQKGSKTKSVKSTTSEVEAGIPKKHQDNDEVTPDTVTNDTDTAKDTPINVSNDLKRTSKQKSSKTKSVKSTTSEVEAGTPKKHLKNIEVTSDTVTNDTDTAKDTPSNVSNKFKQTSKEKSSKTKPTKSTTSEVEVGSPKKHHDQPSIHDTSHQIIYLEVTPDTVSNDTYTAKDTPINVSNDLKQISKQKSSITKSVKSTTSKIEAGTPSKHQDNVEVTPDTVTNDTDTAKNTPSNVSNKLKRSSKEKSSKTKSTKSTTSEIEVGTPKKHHDQPSIHDTSHQIIYLEVTPDTVTNDTDTAKDTPINVSNDLKRTTKQKSSITKSVKSTTSKIEAGPPSKPQENLEVTPDTVTNDTDTATDTPSNVSNKLKRTSKEKSSKTKPTKKCTSEVEVGTPKKHLDQPSIHDTSHQIIYLEVTPDTVTNDTDTAKDTPLNVSNDLKQTSKQKSSIPKSVKSTTSEVEAGKPKKYLKKFEVTSDTVTNDTDTAQDTFSNISNKLKRTSKEKSSKTKPTKSTTSEVEVGTPKTHQDNLEVTPDTVTNDTGTAIDTASNISNNLKHSSSSKSKSAEYTIPEFVSGRPNKNQGNIEETLDNNTSKINNAKDTPATVSNDIKQSSEQNIKINKYEGNITTNAAEGIASTGQDTEVTPENVINNAKRDSNEYVREKETSLKTESDNVVECDKSTCKHFGKIIYDPAITTPVFDSNTECLCAIKRQENLKVAPNTVINNEIETHGEPDRKMMDSFKATSDVTVHKQASSEKVDTKIGNTAKNTATNISDRAKLTSESKDKNNTKFTPKVISRIPVKLPPDFTIENPDTTKERTSNIPGNIKRISKLKSSETESAGNTTPGAIAGKSNEHQDSPEVTTPGDNASSSKCYCRDIYSKAESSSKTMCKKVSSVGFVFDSKLKRDDGSSEDVGRKPKNATKPTPIYIASAEHSRRDRLSFVRLVYGKNAWASSDSVSVTIKSENDDSPLTAEVNAILTTVNSKESISKRVSWPWTKPPTRVDNSSQMTPPLTITIGTDVNIEEKPMKSLKYCSRYCPSVRKSKKDQQAAKVKNRSETTHDKGAASTKPKSNIDGKMQDTVRTSANNECECVTITTTGVVDNISHKENNKDTHDVTDRLKTEPLLLRKKSNIYYCLKPKTGICEDIEYVSDNEKNYGKLKTPPTMRVRFKRTDAKNDVKSKYEPIASSLNTAANNERGTIYYRVKRKCKAEVNSATTMDDIEEIVSTEQQRR